MTAGFQAFTDSGLVQIDGTTQNYVLRSTLSVTTSNGNMPAGKANAGTVYTLLAPMATFAITAINPLIVLYSPSAYSTILSVTGGAPNWTVTIWSNTPAAITVYVFDQSSVAVPSGPGYGLQVFDGSGNLIADGRQRLARIVDTQSGNIKSVGAGWGQYGQVDNQTHTWSYAGTVSKVGVGAVVTPFVSSPTGGTNNGWYDIGGYQTAGTTVNFLWQYYSQGSTSHPGNNNCYGSQYNWSFMAVDLSNI